MADFISSEIEANANLKPTISIDQGERVFVYVRQDLSFAAMYEDPITEAMRQIVSERR
jgi:type IV secretion system protein VirB10